MERLNAHVPIGGDLAYESFTQSGESQQGKIYRIGALSIPTELGKLS